MMKSLHNLTYINKHKITFYVLIGLLYNFSFSQQFAFPEAYGAAAYSEGARGGVVLHVTSLADGSREDVGTLRWAIQGQENKALDRTVVFDVSGIIELQSQIYVSNSPGDEGGYTGSLYIAGQSAPEGGITVTGNRIRISGVPNVIVRYMKFRNSGGYSGSIHVGRNSNSIIDHCSISHVSNSTATSIASSSEGELTKATFSNNLIGQCSYALIIGNTTPQGSRQTEDGSYTVIRNAYYNSGHRVPFKGGSAIKADAVNNIVHNWGNRLIRMDHWDYKLNHIQNYYQASVNTTNRLLWCSYNGSSSATPQIYNSNNFLEDEPRGNYSVPTGFESDESVAWTRFQVNFEALPQNWFVNEPLPLLGRVYEIYSTSNLKDNILPLVGASQYIKDDGTVGFYRDVYDNEYVNGLEIDAEESRNSSLNLPIQSLNNSRPVDWYNPSKSTHIPEVWYDLHMPNGATHNDIAPSGYTWLEEYINQVDSTEPIPVVDVTGVEVTPETAEIAIPEMVTLTAVVMPNNATNPSGEWSSSNTAIATVDANGTVTPLAVGEVVITFTTNDGGFTDASTITVFSEAFQASAGPNQDICLGESATLSASGGTNYLWSNGETSASIVVNPTQTTVYTVTVSDDFGNSDTDDVIVTVNPIPSAYAGEDVFVCEGETVTLTASGGETYLWSTGETTPAITVSPSSDTTYSVEVTSNACSSADEVTVFVNPLPNITVINDVLIVVGETATLTASGGDTYLWSTGETTASINVNPIETTTYTVTATTGNCSSQEAQVTVTVEALLIVNAGEDQRVCENDDYEITLTASSGDSYLWNTGETTQSIVVSPIATSVYTVTVTQGTQQDTDDVTVFVDPNPNVVIVNGENVAIMNGDFVTLSATGANTYVWNNGAAQPNIAVSPSQTTTYEVRGYINDCYDESQITVNVIPEVIADAGEDQEICTGETVTLTANGGDEYVWSTGETTQSIVVSPTENTTYTVTVFNALDFDEDSVTVYVDTNCEEDPNPIDPGNGEPLDFNFSVYPNPVDDFVDLKLSGSNKLTRFYLYDITGKLIYEKRVYNESLSVTSTTRIDVSSYKPGIYLIKLKDIDKEIYHRLVIK